MIRKEDIIWAAGFFDGEGSVQILRYKSKGLTMRVTLANTNKDAVEFYRERWAGNVYEKKRTQKPTHNISWHWQLASRQAVQFLSDVLPYLRVKREHAHIALEFQSLSRRWGGRLGKPQDVIDKHEALHARLAELNWRGRRNTRPARGR